MTPKPRRLGPPGSATWNLILNAAESILIEEGYAELSSRRIADRIGIKQRLVYYYFQTMEDIILETFRRMSTRELDRLNKALEAELPLHEIWSVCINTLDARWITEFMALSSRNSNIRKEVVQFIESSREVHVEAVSRAMRNKKIGAKNLPAAAISFIATSVSLSITREAQLGISKGHREVERVISDFLSLLEPVEIPRK